MEDKQYQTLVGLEAQRNTAIAEFSAFKKEVIIFLSRIRGELEMLKSERAVGVMILKAGHIIAIIEEMSTRVYEKEIKLD